MRKTPHEGSSVRVIEVRRFPPASRIVPEVPSQPALISARLRQVSDRRDHHGQNLQLDVTSMTHRASSDPTTGITSCMSRARDQSGKAKGRKARVLREDRRRCTRGGRIVWSAMDRQTMPHHLTEYLRSHTETINALFVKLSQICPASLPSSHLAGMRCARNPSPLLCGASRPGIPVLLDLPAPLALHDPQ